MRISMRVTSIVLCAGMVTAAGGEPVKLSLDEAVARALEVDEGYLGAREDLTAAEASIVEAKSGLFPSVTLDASATKMIGLPTILIEANSMGPGFPPEDIEFAATYDENLSASLTAVQPLYQGGRAWTAYRLSKSYYALANETLREAYADTVYEVAKAYHDAVLADESVGVANTGVAVAASHVQVAEDRYDAGLVSEYDVLRAKVELANLETTRRQAEDGRAAARRYLLLLLNYEPGTEVALTDRLAFDLEVYNLDDSLTAAEAKRPELAQLEMTLRLAEGNVKIARAGDNPSVFFTASYTDYANEFTLNFADEWRQQGMLILSLSWPIFDGLATRGRVGRARAEFYKAELNRARLREGIDMEVCGAYEALLTAEADVRTHKENVKLAERGLEIARARYEAGLMSNLEVLDAQAALTQARLGYYKSLHGYALAKLDMRRVRGELGE